MVGGLLWVYILLAGYHKVVVGVDELLVFSCYNVLDFLDVLDGNEVAGARHAGVAVLLGFQLGEFLLLVRDVYHLVEDDGVGLGDAVHNGHHVNRHARVVDLDVGIGTYLAGDGGIVYVYQ